MAAASKKVGGIVASKITTLWRKQRRGSTSKALVDMKENVSLKLEAPRSLRDSESRWSNPRFCRKGADGTTVTEIVVKNPRGKIDPIMKNRLESISSILPFHETVFDAAHKEEIRKEKVAWWRGGRGEGRK